MQQNGLKVIIHSLKSLQINLYKYILKIRQRLNHKMRNHKMYNTTKEQFKVMSRPLKRQLILDSLVNYTHLAVAEHFGVGVVTTYNYLNQAKKEALALKGEI